MTIWIVEINPLFQFSLESLLTYPFPFHDRPQPYAHRGDSADV